MDNDTENATATSQMQRDALIMLLVAQSHGLIQQLALLASSEKTAVAGLVLVGQILGVYACGVRPDPTAIEDFERMLSSLSPAMTRRITSPAAAAVAGTDVQAEVASMSQQLKNLLAALAAQTGQGERKAGDSRSLPLRR